MGMKGLAHENLEAARILLDRGLVHAAASRLYYAFFQAAVHALDRAGRKREETRKGLAYWSHKAVGDLVHLARGRGDDSLRSKRLRDLRVRRTTIGVRSDAEKSRNPSTRWSGLFER